jgi:hypothetical protein
MRSLEGIYRISTWQPQYSTRRSAPSGYREFVNANSRFISRGWNFSHELPIRQVIDRLEKMNLSWVHPMHEGSFEQHAFPNYARALRENEFAYRGMLLGREIAKVAPM